MPLRVTARQLQACGIFRKHGCHTKGAGAIVGNLVQESGPNLDSTMYRARPDASGGVRYDLKSGGIAEWLGDRKLSCIAFSRAKEVRLGLARDYLLNDLETQCEFVVHELKYGESGDNPKQYEDLWRQLTTETFDNNGRHPRSIATLAANFMVLYERPKMGAGTDKLGEVRIPYAEAVADRYELIEEAEEPKPQPTEPSPKGPPVPVPQVPGPEVPPPYTPIPTIPPRPSPGSPPVSASTAGRQSAIQDILYQTRGNLLAERASLDAELAIIDETIESFEKLSPVPAIDAPLLALPKPGLNPGIITQKRNFKMNEQALSAFRSVLIAIGGAVAGSGLVDAATVQSVIGIAMAIVPAGWSLWRHRQNGTIAAAAALPDVKKIVTTTAIADSPEFAANHTVVSGH